MLINLIKRPTSKKYQYFAGKNETKSNFFHAKNT